MLLGNEDSHVKSESRESREIIDRADHFFEFRNYLLRARRNCQSLLEEGLENLVDEDINVGYLAQFVVLNPFFKQS